MTDDHVHDSDDSNQLWRLRQEVEDLRARVEILSQVAPASRLAASPASGGRRARGRRIALFAAVAACLPIAVYAATLSIPNEFSNGTIADADEVNQNFQSIATESNAQDVRLAQLEAALAALDIQVASTSADVSNLQSTQILCASQVGNEVYFTGCNVNLGSPD